MGNFKRTSVRIRRKYQNARRVSVAGASIGALSLVLSACGGSTTASNTKSTTASNTSSKSPKLIPITVSLALDPPKMIFIGFWVAKYEGFFKRNGLNVTLSPELSGVQALRAQASGKTLFSAGGTDAVAASAAQGGGQIGIWSYGKDDLSIIAQSSIKSVQDLRGQNIGTGDATGPAYQLSVLALQKAGLTPKDVHFDILNGRPALVSALVSGKISASVFHIDDGLTALSKDSSLHVLEPMYKAAPSYWYGAVAVAQAYAQKNPATVDAFLTAMVQADRWMYSHKSAVVKLGVKYTGESPNVVSQSYDFLASNHLWTQNVGTSISDIKSTLKLYLASKTISVIPPVNKVFTSTYIDNVLKKLGTVKS